MSKRILQILCYIGISALIFSGCGGNKSVENNENNILEKDNIDDVNDVISDKKAIELGQTLELKDDNGDYKITINDIKEIPEGMTLARDEEKGYKWIVVESLFENVKFNNKYINKHGEYFSSIFLGDFIELSDENNIVYESDDYLSPKEIDGYNNHPDIPSIGKKVKVFSLYKLPLDAQEVLLIINNKYTINKEL